MSEGGGSTRTVVALVALICVMTGLSFSAAPLYNLFCRVTGYSGATSVAEAGSDRVLDREITVRFDGSVDHDMPWEFKPVETKMKVGETGLAYFTATNPTDRVIAGAASYNVTPFSAGGYVSKIQCFCFTEQVLEPGETAEMPVTFFVDSAIMEDEEARRVRAITLSYSLHETASPEGWTGDAIASDIDETNPAG